MLENIRHLEFLPTNFYEFENILIKHGKLTIENIDIKRIYFKCNYDTPKIVSSVEDINPEQFNIVEMGNVFMVSKIKPSLEKIEIKENDLNDTNLINTLNYVEFFEYFDFDALYNMFYNKFKVYCDEIIDDVKKNLFKASTKNSAKLLVAELSHRIISSENFLKKVKSKDIEEFKFFEENGIQADLYEHLEKLVKQLKSSLNNLFTLYLKENDLIITKKSLNDENDSKSYKAKLRGTKVYKYALLFADGKISFENFTVQYKNKSYVNISSLAKIISQDIPEISATSIQPYLNQTVTEANSEKNLFSKKKLKYLELIALDFKTNGKELSKFFIDKLQNLLFNTQE
ncbi:MAG: hypothetical protein ACX93I_02005 [Winogradskyella sp.]